MPQRERGEVWRGRTRMRAPGPAQGSNSNGRSGGLIKPHQSSSGLISPDAPPPRSGMARVVRPRQGAFLRSRRCRLLAQQPSRVSIASAVTRALTKLDPTPQPSRNSSHSFARHPHLHATRPAHASPHRCSMIQLQNQLYFRREGWSNQLMPTSHWDSHRPWNEVRAAPPRLSPTSQCACDAVA